MNPRAAKRPGAASRRHTALEDDEPGDSTEARDKEESALSSPAAPSPSLPPAIDLNSPAAQATFALFAGAKRFSRPSLWYPIELAPIWLLATLAALTR